MSPTDLSYTPRRSRFDYGSGGDVVSWTTPAPVRAWLPQEGSVGGRAVSSGGVPAAYVVRRDVLLGLSIRFREPDWADLLAMVRWGQNAGLDTQVEGIITWYPDALETGTSYSTWLHAPAAGQRVQPQRSQEYPRFLELPITLRRDGEEPWALDYYALDT